MSFQTIIPSSGDMSQKVYANNPGAGHGIVNEALEAGKQTEQRALVLAGDVTGSVNTDLGQDVSITTALETTGVTPGTYTKATVDAKGRVTGGDTLSASDIPAQTLSNISDAGTAAALNAGTEVGNVPVIGSDGKLPESVIPGGGGGSSSSGGGATFNATLTVAAWNASTFIQPISNAEITETARVIVQPVMSMSDAQRREWAAAQIFATAQVEGSLTVKYMGTKPTLDLPVECWIL